MKKKLGIFGVVAIIGMAVLLTGCDHGTGFGPHRGGPGGKGDQKRRDRGLDFMAWKLDLSKDQKKESEKIMNEIQKKQDAQRKLHENSMKEAYKMIEKDNLSEKEVLAFIEKMEKEHEKMIPFYAKKIVEMHSILNQDQKRKLVDEMRKRRR